jgi:hypothetical protein
MHRRTLGRGLVATVAAFALLPAVAFADPPGLTRIFTDPFTNTSSQHATAVEPDTFGVTSRMVMATQSGRFFNGGGSDIGFATTSNGGQTWTSGVLPGITQYPPGGGGTFQRVSDPSVAYDPKHNVWMISTVPINSSVVVPKIFLSRSTNGGLSFGNPVTVANAPSGGNFDKNWTVCDGHPASPFYGNCYTVWDDNGHGNLLKMSRSTDGGLTWGPARSTANSATGIGGQPVVQPNGTVIVPADNANETSVIAWRSTDGGATWTAPITVASTTAHSPAGGLRSGPLPSAEIDRAGKVFVVWQSCRFRSGCSGNDIVMSTSTAGTTWTAPVRIPIGTTSDGHDNFIPGVAVDSNTSGPTGRIGLTFSYYTQSACGSSCALNVGFLQSNNGGSTWTAVQQLAGPFALALIANTSQGRMVGDYISSSWVDTPAGRRAFGAFAVGQAPVTGKAFDEATFVPSGGLTRLGGERPTETLPQRYFGSAEHKAPPVLSQR